jgi:acyl-CoA synthetase (AMP-forming)/AMP-acid ligase II
VLEGYGLSESPARRRSTSTPSSARCSRSASRSGASRSAVVDENDQPLPPGEEHVGEIVIRGHNIMKGYYKKPEATAEAFKGGWFHTGDLAYMDDDGFFFIVDRKKDLVIRGGYNVYPREVEEVLFAHPAVAEAAVIGKPTTSSARRCSRSSRSSRRRRDAGGDPGLVQGAAGGLQVPARGAPRRRAAQGTDRQDPEEGAEG